MTPALCTIFTILLTLWNSEQKNGLLVKLFVFHLILMKLGEIVVHMDNYNFTRFHQNQMKNKKVLLIAHFSVQNFKVSVESWKSYIVYIVRPCFGNAVGRSTMYNFHDSTDTLKFWTEKRAINKTFLFFIWFWWNLVKL